ncbi:MAG: hypothetical protein HY722_06135 [Planctomycetes bacterium]|nr:hypothetical protein [Planctomycetota bacterium]
MMIAGLDEAGYGPRLGPLAVAAVVLRLPEGRDGRSAWDLLRGAVGRPGERGAPRVVGDSKRVHRGRRALSRLEAQVLPWAALALAGVPITAGALRRGLVEPGDLAGRPEPWDRDLDALALPLAGDRDAAGAAARDLGRDLAERGALLAGVRLRLLGVRAFNAGCLAAGGTSPNKARLLGRLAGTLLEWALGQNGGEALEAVADKHGSRDRYGALLAEALPGRAVAAESEGRAASWYRLRGGAEAARVGFLRGADGLDFAAGLASLFAKYLREVHMAAFNAWWLSHVPGLAPTAGYPADARRFLDAIEKGRRALGVDVQGLVRCR